MAARLCFARDMVAFVEYLAGLEDRQHRVKRTGEHKGHPIRAKTNQRATGYALFGAPVQISEKSNTDASTASGVRVRRHSTVSGTCTCVVCEVLKEGVAPVSPFHFLARAQHVAIRGYPFNALSEKSLAPLEHSAVLSLALIDANITDVEKNTFSGFSSLKTLSLDSNRLASVKQAWFAGLKKLVRLTLSNNNIRQIEPRSFVHLDLLFFLDLESNLLHDVDPAWFNGMRYRMLHMNLSLNPIHTISRGSFQLTKLRSLDLSGTDVSCLDEDVFRGQSWLNRLHVGSGMLSSVNDVKPHELTWSLLRLASTNIRRGSVKLVVAVPRFLFCVSHNGVTPEVSFRWMFYLSDDDVPYNIESQESTCRALDLSKSTSSIRAPVVVLATHGDSLTDKLDTKTLEQCRQVWEYDGGIAVGLMEDLVFRLVSLSTGNETFGGVGMSFVQTQDTNTFTTTAHTNGNNAKNIKCILVNKVKHRELFFTAIRDQPQTHTTSPTYTTDTDHSINLTHYSEYTDKDHTSSEQGDNSTLQDGSTTYAPVHVSEQIEVPSATDHVLISVVVSVVVGLAVSSIAVLVWKMCLARTTEDDRPIGNAQVWTIPRAVAFPGLLRSASLPAGSSRTASHGVVSYTSMPTLLQSMEPASCDISFDRSVGQRPLPRLPHVYSEVPDDAISVSGVVRSALSTSGSAVAPDDAASCRSLPAVLPSIEPTYSEIPDHMAAAQHPLPVSHTYSEVPDDEESVGIPFYADAAEILLQIVTNRVQNGQAYQDITTRGSITTYGSPEINNATRQAPDAQGIRAHINLSSRKALVSHVHATDQSVRTYVNVTDEILSRGQKITGAHVAFLTFPGAYWQMSGVGSRITPRRASLPLVTLPITKELQGLHNTTRRASLPTGTLHNTSWLRAIPGEGTRNMARRASLPTVTPPNTYWPWEIPGEGTRNTPRRVSLPTVTLPNTYWPWGIPGEGTHYVTQSRASLPTVTLPNTYWPWEIPGEGTRNTPRRVSLPTVTLPNTYWPWGIPGEGTHYVTQSRASLPFVTLANTYWPWGIPGEEKHDTP
ncbi:hypothetical protein Bbelb_126190 [Branchiostoma belcheri]|nr:hypothetical protein Bbelb_126190 [Branchiostoma belcheri]